MLRIQVTRTVLICRKYKLKALSLESTPSCSPRRKHWPCRKIPFNDSYQYAYALTSAWTSVLRIPLIISQECPSKLQTSLRTSLASFAGLVLLSWWVAHGRIASFLLGKFATCALWLAPRGMRSGRSQQRLVVQVSPCKPLYAPIFLLSRCLFVCCFLHFICTMK